ncbi:hypothetical protein PR003_g31070 [Phytophthora rubi]|uniref:Uncharacterized protein n=1 Tax=Phytophthora rubi TaxID=129364 RepID=A0A6A4B5X4_9STRA|nr:hypothetical protein PR003_g31070 [Phytophthora rubi]
MDNADQDRRDVHPLAEPLAAPKDGEASNAHLTIDDYRIMVTWMEIKSNFNAIHGTGDKLPVGGKPKVRKQDAFQALADHLSRKTTNASIRGLSGRNTQQRWRTYMRRFKKTLKARNSETGLGLTKRELAKQVSIPEKLEIMCPHFSRMLALFGEKPNVTPSATVELGVPPPSSPGSYATDSSDESCDSAECHLNEQLTYVPAAQSQQLPPATQRQDVPTQSATPVIFLEVVPPAVDASSQSSTPSSAVASTAASASYQGPRPASAADPASSIASTSAEDAVVQLPPRQSSASHLAPAEGATSTPRKPKPKIFTAHQQAKRRKPNSADKSESSTRGNSTKNERPNANATRLSLSAAYARNSEAKVDFLKQKLDEERRQWNAKQEAEKLQREMEAQHRDREFGERKSLRKHEMVLELLRQNKSMDEIELFLQKFG